MTDRGPTVAQRTATTILARILMNHAADSRAWRDLPASGTAQSIVDKLEEHGYAIVRLKAPRVRATASGAARWHLDPVTNVASHDANGKPLRGPCPYVRNGRRCRYFSRLGNLSRADHPGSYHWEGPTS